MKSVEALADPGTADYVRLALTFMAGFFQLAFGLAWLGTLINFVSHSVIVGFAAGAAFLIATRCAVFAKSDILHARAQGGEILIPS